MPALLVLIVVTAVWGLTFVQVKDAVALYPLFAFLASVRDRVAGARRAGRRAPPLARPRGPVGGASLGLLLAAGYALQTAGLERTSVSCAGFITGIYVVLTPLFGSCSFAPGSARAAWFGVRSRSRASRCSPASTGARSATCSCSPAQPSTRCRSC